MARIHDRMPVILTLEGYERWLANIEPDPADLMVPYPSDETRIWPVGPRVNSAGNDDAGVLEPVGEDE
jgi:putative SOS response-associated peptidase YedK